MILSYHDKVFIYNFDKIESRDYMQNNGYMKVDKLLSDKTILLLFLSNSIIIFLGSFIGNFKELSEANIGSVFFMIPFMVIAVVFSLPQLLGTFLSFEFSKNEKLGGLKDVSYKYLKLEFIDSFFCILTSLLFCQAYLHHVPFLSVLSIILSILLCIILHKKKKIKV